MKKILILVFVVASTLSFAQESVLLRLNYTNGDKYLVQTSQSVNSSAMAMENVTDMSMEVVGSADGVFTTDMKITKVAVDMMQGGMSMSYDSSKKDSELDQMGLMMKQQMGPMMQMVITTKADVYGKIQDISVTPDSPLAAQFKNQTGVSFPKEAVKVGDTWKDETDQQGIKITIEYKVTSITSNKVILAATGVVSGAAEGKMTGDFEIDKKSGVPLKTSIKNEMSVQGQSMKIDVETTMKKI